MQLHKSVNIVCRFKHIDKGIVELSADRSLAKIVVVNVACRCDSD
jgi:hypothetical protein